MIDKKELFGTARTMSLYMSTDRYAAVLVLQSAEDSYASYARVSEPVEIVFKPITDDATVQYMVQAIDAEENSARMALEQKLVELRERKASLLALTHQTVSEISPPAGTPLCPHRNDPDDCIECFNIPY